MAVKVSKKGGEAENRKYCKVKHSSKVPLRGSYTRCL